jgi:hypothetical protein
MKTSICTPRRGRQRRNGHRARRNRHFRNGHRAAAVRALTAAGLVIDGRAPTIGAACERCGSNPAYVRAGITLIRSENKGLIARVVTGKVPLLAAARQVQQLAELLASYRVATAAVRVGFAKAVGPTVLFDTTLVPAL